ncbi:MAG: hypothetical protein JW751_08385 [Polyangiaceae bacterium]|nr:hypothetical protein [Polyangiaceae bacterium]
MRFRKQDHSKLVALTRRAERVVICNDSEESGAGEAGAVETARALFEAGRDIRVAVIPRPDGVAKIDVNELVATQGADALRQVIAGAQRYPEYLLEKIPADTPKQELNRALRPLLEAVVRLSPIQQSDYRALIAARFGIGVGPVGERLRQIAKERKRNEAKARADGSERPSIMLGGRQLREVIAEAGAVVAEANERLVAEASQRPIPSNDAAPLFVRGGRLVRVDTSKGSPAVAELDEVEVYGLLARVKARTRSRRAAAFLVVESGHAPSMAAQAPCSGGRGGGRNFGAASVHGMGVYRSFRARQFRKSERGQRWKVTSACARSPERLVVTLLLQVT